MKTFRVKAFAGNCSVVWRIILKRPGVRLPQHANLRLSIRWESLREPATEIASHFSYTRCEDQRVDLGTIFVDNDEIISSSRASIPRELGCLQIYQLQGALDVVRYNVETHRGHSLEILNVSTMIHTVSPWRRSTLCHDQAIKRVKAKVHVHADSVLCLGKVHSHSEANEKWKSQIR